MQVLIYVYVYIYIYMYIYICMLYHTMSADRVTVPLAFGIEIDLSMR